MFLVLYVDDNLKAMDSHHLVDLTFKVFDTVAH